MKASAPMPRSATSNIDVRLNGVQHGHLSLPCASAESAHGSVQIPVCVLKNGDGPVVSLLAGSRGDEYDGRIALHNLIHSIALEDINGCLIVVPTMNPTAASMHARCSSVDNKELDTCFPGQVDGSITEQIAAKLVSDIIEPCELIIELQSGGNTSVTTPLAAVHFNADNYSLQQQTEQSMIAFGAPYSARLLPKNSGSLANIASELEKGYMAIHLGGGGSSHAHCSEVANIGCKNVLVQKGILNQDFVLRSTRMLEVGSESNYVIAPCDGLLELLKEPGAEVYMGSPIARIIQTGHTGAKATILKADRNGILMTRHHGGQIQQGNCAAIIADEVQR